MPKKYNKRHTWTVVNEMEYQSSIESLRSSLNERLFNLLFHTQKKKKRKKKKKKEQVTNDRFSSWLYTKVFICNNCRNCHRSLTRGFNAKDI